MGAITRHTKENTIWACEARCSTVPASSVEPTTGVMLNLSKFVTLRGERTSAVISNLSLSGCCRRRWRTEPPTYPRKNVQEIRSPRILCLHACSSKDENGDLGGHLDTDDQAGSSTSKQLV